MLGEFSGLVGENGVTDIVDFGEDAGLRFGGSDVLEHLVEMAFECFYGVGVVLLNVLGSEQWPTNEVVLVGLDPGGFDRVPTHGKHPLDGLFSGREVIDAVGML